ncbi:unnamed protein product [Sphenostylis stenocarpa]|uniref:Uncharacterized protein n=1 Tax=Sphenostylis stenocarpa TaxID=92480 RepID=A0AA86VHU1_9FABA|nr:unnamed protein product [Sphenostylis stenocarpa]
MEYFLQEKLKVEYLRRGKSLLESLIQKPSTTDVKEQFGAWDWNNKQLNVQSSHKRSVCDVDATIFVGRALNIILGILYLRVYYMIMEVVPYVWFCKETK